MRKRMEEIERLARTNEEKMENLEKMKEEKEGNLEKLSESLEEVRERRIQLEYQLNIIRNEGEMIEQEFKQKVK